MKAETGTHADAKASASKIEKMLDDTVESLRASIENVDDPHAKAMFETSAEVLLGLSKTFKDYRSRDEAAWR